MRVKIVAISVNHLLFQQSTDSKVHHTSRPFQRALSWKFAYFLLLLQSVSHACCTMFLVFLRPQLHHHPPASATIAQSIQCNIGISYSVFSSANQIICYNNTRAKYYTKIIEEKWLTWVLSKYNILRWLLGTVEIFFRPASITFGSLYIHRFDWI